LNLVSNASNSLADFKKEFDRLKVRAHCLCGSDRSLPFLKRDRYGIAIVPVYCLNCGHIYSRYRLSETDTAKFYDAIYRSLYSGIDGLKTPEAATARIRNATKNILPVFRSLFASSGNRVVIEWGCGAGWNLVPFKQAGAETYGFDFDSEYVEWGSKQFDLRLHTVGLNPDLRALVENRADLLIINHVLEHVAQPVELLTQLMAIVKPGGYVFVGLPFLENLPTWHFRGFFHIAHLHYFSMPYWKALMTFNGFEVVSADRKNGNIVLRQTLVPAKALETPRFRAYNGWQLAKFAIYYQIFYKAWRLFVEIVKRVPGVERTYTFALQRLHNPRISGE
jgi:SAM-dependent methyltransferase